VIRYVGCDFAQERLDAFADGELPMGDQVLVESHLRWCNVCAARLEDLRTISASLRQGARVHDGSHSHDRGGDSGTPTDDGVGRALSAMQAEVLAQVDTEYEQ
jgi:anti-sigma factor ChrR (cupin superfamily)